MNLDFIYYPVSFILWCWHQAFGFLLGPSNFIGWALSIILLVFTLRLVLLKPAISQIRSMRKMQKFQPEIKKLQEKYKNDRQRQAQEMQKLQKEHGVNPLGGCLPLVLQIPVFIGLNHVLRSFREGTTEVYYFKAHDVASYLDAKIFGVHLGDVLFGIPSLGGTGGFHWYVAPLAIPLMVVAGIATHFTARLSVQRQIAMGTPRTSQTDIMNKVTLYLFPLGVLIFGGGFPIGLLLYWLSNNVWTLAQQNFVFRRIDREEEQAKEEALQNRANLAPRPGQKPVVQRKRGAAQVEDAVPGVVDAVEDAVPLEDAKPVQDAPRRQAAKAKGARNAAKDPRQAVKPTVPNPAANKTAANKTAAKAANKPAPGAKPAPGVKPPPGVRPSLRTASAKNANRTNGATKQDGTSPTVNGKSGAASEIPGLISDRSRRKKQNRKRG